MAGTGYLYDIARLVAGVAGLNGTYCGEGDGDTVRALPESLEDGTPAAVVLDGDEAVTAANWERHRSTPEIHVYVSRSAGLGAGYELARSFKGPILAAVRAGVSSDEIASLVLTGYRQIETREWPVESGRWYFVLPVTLECVANVTVTYSPPQPIP